MWPWHILPPSRWKRYPGQPGAGDAAVSKSSPIGGNGFPSLESATWAVHDRHSAGLARGASEDRRLWLANARSEDYAGQATL